MTSEFTLQTVPVLRDPLYHLDHLAARPTEPVLVVEGEKAAEAAARWFPDHVATTWPGGCKAVGYADFTPLAHRQVTIWPDADQPGREAASALADAVKRAGAEIVRLVDVPPDLPTGWDLADPVPAGRDQAWARQVLEAAGLITARSSTTAPKSLGFARARRDDGLWPYSWKCPVDAEAALEAACQRVYRAGSGRRLVPALAAAVTDLAPLMGSDLAEAHVDHALTKAASATGATPEQIAKGLQRGHKNRALGASVLPGAELAGARSRQADPADGPLDPQNWFEQRADGLWYVPPLDTRRADERGDFEPVRLAAPFEISAETWCDESREHGLLLGFRDRWGVAREMVLSLGDLNLPHAPWRKALGNLGLMLEPGQRAAALLTRYLVQGRADARVEIVRRTGWRDPNAVRLWFVLPDENIAPAGALPATVRFDAGALGAPVLSSRGTLDGWQERVARPAAGNSRLGVALMAAFAAPLLRVVNQDSGGLHLRGGSSVGKTTALRLAASVWGATLFNWRSTDNGLEAIAAHHNDLLLALDEIGQVDPRVVAHVAYMLANGRGKLRMNADRRANPPPDWRLLFLSTGETSLADAIKAGGGQVMAGQEIRFLDLPADAGAGLGLFNRVPDGVASAAAFAEHLRQATDAENGTAGRALIRWLVTGFDAESLRQRLSRDIAAWVQRRISAGADGQVIRAGHRFALLEAAGRLAVEAGVLPWSLAEVEWSMVQAFGDWVAHRGGTGAGEVQIVLDRLRLFIDQHGASRFQDLGAPWSLPLIHDTEDVTRADRPILQRAGYRRRASTDAFEYLFFPSTWKSEIVCGLDLQNIHRSLMSAGVLDGDGGSKASKLVKIDGSPSRFYIVNRAKLNDDSLDHRSLLPDL